MGKKTNRHGRKRYSGRAPKKMKDMKEYKDKTRCILENKGEIAYPKDQSDCRDLLEKLTFPEFQIDSKIDGGLLETATKYPSRNATRKREDIADGIEENKAGWRLVNKYDYNKIWIKKADGTRKRPDEEINMETDECMCYRKVPGYIEWQKGKDKIERQAISEGINKGAANCINHGIGETSAQDLMKAFGLGELSEELFSTKNIVNHEIYGSMSATIEGKIQNLSRNDLDNEVLMLFLDQFKKLGDLSKLINKPDNVEQQTRSWSDWASEKVYGPKKGETQKTGWGLFGGDTSRPFRRHGWPGNFVATLPGNEEYATLGPHRRHQRSVSPQRNTPVPRTVSRTVSSIGVNNDETAPNIRDELQTATKYSPNFSRTESAETEGPQTATKVSPEPEVAPDFSKPEPEETEVVEMDSDSSDTDADMSESEEMESASE